MYVRYELYKMPYEMVKLDLHFTQIIFGLLCYVITQGCVESDVYEFSKTIPFCTKYKQTVT